MNAIKRLLGGLSTQYLIRAYVLSALYLAFTVAIIFGLANAGAEASVPLIYFGLCALLFPFAKHVWDELKGMVLGENFLILPIRLVYPAKIFINLGLWMFALLIAPFGIAYIWFRTKDA